ncbi:MAG: hypothetical protein HY026_08320 [Deltaproteobacteria bacterium]|nr:hypothetical protein [Deltaproteobacteria bacterium]
MDAKLQIDYWLESAAHDMEVADTLFRKESERGRFYLLKGDGSILLTTA